MFYTFIVNIATFNVIPMSELEAKIFKFDDTAPASPGFSNMDIF
jgi:hypothetical protein